CCLSSSLASSFLLLLRPPPCSTLFPYTTLFRSRSAAAWYASIAFAVDASWLSDRSPRPIRMSTLTLVSVSTSACARSVRSRPTRSEEHTSELQSPYDLVCRLLLEKKKTKQHNTN